MSGLDELARHVPLVVGASVGDFIRALHDGSIGADGPDHLCAIAWVVDAEGRILLIDHPRYGWSCPGGHVDDAETVEAAAVRELAEETGLVGSVASAVPLTLTRSAGCLRSPTGSHWSFGVVVHAAHAQLRAGEFVDRARWFEPVELDALPEPRSPDLPAVAAYVALNGSLRPS